MSILTSLKNFVNRYEGRDNPDEFVPMDLGMTRAEFNTLRHSRKNMVDQIEGMAGRYGLTVADLSANRWSQIDISLVCADCKKARACQNFLNGKGRFELSDCPNAENFSELATAH